MTAFTDLLRKERTLVCSSVELLEFYRRELESGGSISIADMRMAVYALHGIFEATLLLKEERLLYVKMEQLPLPDEIRSLIPLRRIANRKVQEDLLSLRLGIEKNDFQTQTKGPIVKRIEGLVSLVQSYICDTEDHLLNYAHSNLEPATQIELFQVANQIDKADPSGQLLRSLQMVNVLRLARGLPAA